MRKSAKAQEQTAAKAREKCPFCFGANRNIQVTFSRGKVDAAKNGTDISEKGEQAIIQDYLRTLAKTVKVSDAEILDFYNSNKETLSGAALAQVKPQIEQFLLQQKQQELINKHVRTIGQRMQIEISASWLKAQAALAKDNPVDRAREAGNRLW